MFVIFALEALAAVLAGILPAACSKRAEGVTYTRLDKAGRITNILLIPVYAALSLFIMAISIFSYPAYNGFLGILGWIVCVLIACGPLYCGLSLGFSAALRKKGKSKQSFAVQFAGFAGIVFSFGLFVIFYDNLLSSLN